MRVLGFYFYTLIFGGFGGPGLIMLAAALVGLAVSAMGLLVDNSVLGFAVKLVVLR